MYMRDWINVLDGFIKMSRQQILTDSEMVSAELASKKALLEYERYKKKTANDLSIVEQQFIQSIEQANKKLKSSK